MYGQHDVSSVLIQQGGGEVDDDPAARRRGGGCSRTLAGLRQAAAGGGQGVARGGRREDLGAAALPLALLYIGPQGGRWPWEMQSPKGAAARGVECPPRQVVRPPPTPGFPTLGAGGPRGAPQPTRGWFPSHFSPYGPLGQVAPSGGPPRPFR